MGSAVVTHLTIKVAVTTDSNTHRNVKQENSETSVALLTKVILWSNI